MDLPSLRNFRANKGAYDQWAELVGDSAFSWDNFLPFLKKSTTIGQPDYSKRPKNATIDDNPASWLPAGGPLHISWPNWGSPFGTWGMIALKTIGLIETRDLNNGVLQGSGWNPFTVNPAAASRDSSQTSFLQSVKSSNPGKLTVYTHHMAKKIIFDSNKAAVGVHVNSTDKNRSFVLSAKKEVILSAGALQSPQMLMVSGIGPPETLRKFNISILSDLRGVGRNLQDHSMVASTYEVKLETKSRYWNDPVYACQADQDYNQHQAGILTCPTGPIAFEKLTTNSSIQMSNSTKAIVNRAFSKDWPEIEYLIGDTIPDMDPKDGKNYASILTALVAPTSKGSVTISSADANDPPIFDFAMLENDADQELLLNGFKRTRAVWGALSNITIGVETFPGPGVKTDAQILAFLRDTVSTVWHATSTCTMGKRTDPGAVIDSHARVYGVNRLRVVDASALPFMPAGHPQSSIYALAEKISEDIISGQ